MPAAGSIKSNQPRFPGADHSCLAIRGPSGSQRLFLLGGSLLSGRSSLFGGRRGLLGRSSFLRGRSSFLRRSGLCRSSLSRSRSLRRGSSLLCRSSSLFRRSGFLCGGCLFGGCVFHRVILPNIKKSRSPWRSQRVPYINLFAKQVKRKVSRNMRQTPSTKGPQRKKRGCAKMFNAGRCVFNQ